MSVAALWDELTAEDEDPLGDCLPGPFGGASPAGGQPLLPTQLAAARYIVEIAFGADLTADPAGWNWIDVTGDVIIDTAQVATTQGRMDESTQAQPAGCQFQLDNTRGDYTPYQATGMWYPNVKLGTPVRVQVTPDGTTSRWTVRFWGYGAGITPSWNEMSKEATVTVVAAGELRRLQQGVSPLHSPLYRAISTANPAPIAYWSIEDGANSTQAASGVAGGSPLVSQGVVKFAAVTGPDGSGPLADLTAAGRLTGQIAASSADSWRAECAVKINTLAGGAFTAVLQVVTTGTVSLFEIDAANAAGGGIYLQWINNGTSGSAFSNFAVDDGLWHWIRLDVQTSGSDLAWSLRVDGNVVVSGTIAGVPVPQAKRAVIDPTGGSAEAVAGLGHLVIWAPSVISVDTLSASSGFAGENAVTRLQRLCAEQGERLTLTGTSVATMGAQSIDTFINLLRECEATDGGVLADGLGPGLMYTARAARYNLATSITLDASADEVGYPFVPVNDDQRIRNLVKVSRKNGSSATYQDATGPLGTNAIGTYESSLTVNAADDGNLYNRAAWEVHLGTVQGLRYPTTVVDLMAIPQHVTDWLALLPGARVDTTNVSALAPTHPLGTVSQIVEGWSETIDNFHWSATATCSPYDPWSVAVFESTFRLDLGGVTLQSGASALAGGSGDTWTVVVDPAYPLLTQTATRPTDFPFDVNCEGEQVTVTAIVGAASPQTLTVVRGVNGVVKPHPAGAAISLWKPPVVAL